MASRDKVPTPQRARAKQVPRPTTAAKQAAFLAHYAQVGVISYAAVATGIDRGEHYRWLADDETGSGYRARFDQAHEVACDALEAEARRRAVEGWMEPVFGRGDGQGAGTVQVGTITRYSDRLLELLLKAKRPREFRERISVGGDRDAGPVHVQSRPMTEQEAADLYRRELERPLSLGVGGAARSPGDIAGA